MDAETRKQWLKDTPKDMHWLIRKRATGRTTRMVEAALRADKEGYAVYVVTSPRVVKQFKALFPKDTTIKVEAVGSNIDTMGNFDWKTMRLRGAHPNCRVFVDHYCIEQNFAAVLKEWHRYDEELKDS